MSTGINELQTLTSIYHTNVNVNLMVANVIKMKNRIMINADVRVKT